MYRNASSTHTRTDTRRDRAQASVRGCDAAAWRVVCVRIFVGGTISGGSCRHLLPRVHPRSPPRRCVGAIAGHQTPSRTRMPSRVVMACGQLSPPAIAFRPHLGRRRWLTLRLYPRRRPVSTRRHALVASALSHLHPKHPVGADHQRHGRQLLGTAEPITGLAVRRLPRRPHPIVMGMTTHRRPRHPHLLPMWHGCSGRPKAVARSSLSSIRDGWHVAALSLTAPSRSATGQNLLTQALRLV